MSLSKMVLSASLATSRTSLTSGETNLVNQRRVNSDIASAGQHPCLPCAPGQLSTLSPNCRTLCTGRVTLALCHHTIGRGLTYGL